MGLDPGLPGSGPGLKAGAKPLSPPGIPEEKFFFKRFYLFIHERQRERDAKTQAEGEAGFMQEA